MTVLVKNLQSLVALLRYFGKSAMLPAVTRVTNSGKRAIDGRRSSGVLRPGDLGKEGR